MTVLQAWQRGWPRMSIRKSREGGKCVGQSNKQESACITYSVRAKRKPTVASRFTTLTTQGLVSSAPSSASAGLAPRRTMCKYVICSLGEASSVACSSSAANRMVTLTPSFSASFPFLFFASCAAGSASTTAKAGPEMLRFRDRLRKWKRENRRRAFCRPVGPASDEAAGLADESLGE